MESNINKYLAILILGCQVEARGALASHLDDLADIAKRAARVAGSAPVEKLEKLEDLARSQALREAMEKGIKEELEQLGKKMPGNLDVAGRQAFLIKEFPQLMRALAKGADSSLLKRIEALDFPAQLTAATMARGGERIANVVGDIRQRGLFLKEGGGPLLLAAGTHGDELVNEALKLDLELGRGVLKIPSGLRPATLADFGEAMARQEKGWSFWKEKLKPHWKELAACGALTAYLTFPDQIQDAAGNLTERGFEKIAELGGRVLAEAVAGVGNGSKKAAGEIIDSAKKSFFTGWKSLYSWIGLLAFLALGSVIVPRSRAFHWRWIKRLWYPPPTKTEDSRKPSSKPEPGLDKY